MNAIDKSRIPRNGKITRPLWLRITLLSVLAYEGAGALFGGVALIIAPDGRLMDMPVEIMHGFFPDFLIPGIILFGLGILNTIAFIMVLRKHKTSWLMASMATGGLFIWFWIEIAIIGGVHWLHAMWGLPVIAGIITAIPLIPPHTLQKTLLTCGILSSLLYAFITVIVPLRWSDYDSVTQTVSELSAVGAPTRILWIVLSAPYSLLIAAFGVGVWKFANENRRLRVVGILLFIYGCLGVLWPFAPMHLRETLAAGGGTSSDTLHIALGVVTELLYLVALGIAAAALGWPFRIYSAVTFLLLLIFAVLTFIEAPNIGTNQPTPMIGVWERVNIGIFLLWVIVLAAVLLKRYTVRNEKMTTEKH